MRRAVTGGCRAFPHDVPVNVVIIGCYQRRTPDPSLEASGEMLQHTDCRKVPETIYINHPAVGGTVRIKKKIRFLPFAFRRHFNGIEGQFRIAPCLAQSIRVIAVTFSQITAQSVAEVFGTIPVSAVALREELPVLPPGKVNAGNDFPRRIVCKKMPQAVKRFSNFPQIIRVGIGNGKRPFPLSGNDAAVAVKPCRLRILFKEPCTGIA